MDIEHGKIVGNMVIDRDYIVHGMCTGNVRVVADGHLTLFGMCTANVSVEAGGELRLHGMVTGNVLNNGGKVFVAGMITGVLESPSGDTEIDPAAVVSNR